MSGSEPASEVRYRVVRACVVAATQTSQGVRRLHYYRDAILPRDVPQEQIDHFLSRGLVAEVRMPASGPAKPEPVAAAAKPAKAEKSEGA